MWFHGYTGILLAKTKQSKHYNIYLKVDPMTASVLFLL